MGNEGRMKCPWMACVNNTSGLCMALNRVAVTKNGGHHILDIDSCPFYKTKENTKMYGGKNKMFFFCDRKMCGSRCNNTCIYTPNVEHALDPEGYPFGRDPVDGNFYQMPNVLPEKHNIDDVRRLINGEVTE